MNDEVKQKITKVSFKKDIETIEEPDDILETCPFLIIKSFNQGNRIFYLPPDKDVVIGRLETSDIYLDDDLISRSHLSVVNTRGLTILKDLNTTNGTTVNGVDVKEKILEEGDEIILGNSVLHYSVPISVAGKKGIILKTHSYFENRLEEELDRASRYQRPLSLMMLEMEKSALTEEEPTLGGKKIPVQLVSIINSIIRAMDLLGFYGNGQLELMLPETNKREAYALADRIYKQVLSQTQKTVFIGIATFPDDALSKELLVDKSRQALKISKKDEKRSIADVSDNHRNSVTLLNQDIVVKCEKTKEVFDLATRIAPTNITVLINGETGVGKEIIAQTIHHQSERKDKPLVCINCAALPESLLESELFGHEKGSFTGADRTKIGLFESAKGGTIFLDEVGEMTLKTQVKLLRVLQNRRIMRVGSTSELSVDVRVLAATNKNLEKAIADGSFREDLYYRLNVITITIPPLRERLEEIPALVNHFILQFSRENNKEPLTISPEAIEILCAYDWPGNIRELKNCIERAIVIADGNLITKEHLSTKFLRIPFSGTKSTLSSLSSDMSKNMERAPDRGQENKETFVGDMKEVVQNYERKLIINVLKKCNWNQTKAADILKIPRRTLVSKLKKYNINKVEPD